jgi:hypothetical protein
MDGTENVPVNGELTVLIDGKETLSRPLTFDSIRDMASPIDWSIPLKETLPCSPGDTVEIWLRIEDSYGIRYDCLVQRFTLNTEYGLDNRPRFHAQRRFKDHLSLESNKRREHITSGLPP